MNISYEWLQELLPIRITPEEIAERLTSIGLETGSIEEIESVPGGLKGLVIGHVVEVKPHDNSDHLHITKVDVGNGEILQIVCGAPNVVSGKAAVVATIGTILGSGDNKFTIKKSKIRGVESFGMLCSEAEIGISNDHNGIIMLDLEKVTIGMPASEYFQLQSDYCLEVDITPNRVDATSHYGVARDLAAQLISEGNNMRPILPKVSERTKGASAVEIIVDDTTLCPRFMGIVIKNVKVGDSPEWIKKRLTAIGQHSVNNIVDITNYVLHEYGQPLHAYDLKKVGGKIVIKTAKDGLKMITLDGEERILSDKDIIVHNGDNEPLCIAGVMGGKDSGVSGSTTDIFLESANFHPTYVRKTARRLGINTDSSFRFERGLDANNCEWALLRAIDLILQEAGGDICGHIGDCYPKPMSPYQVALSLSKMDNLIGVQIDRPIVKEILVALSIAVVREEEGVLHLEVPRYRIDVQRDVDVIEEILRIYGYNRVGLTGYIHANLSNTTKADRAYHRSLVISEQLVGKGYNEILCNSLSSSSFYQGINSYPFSKCVQLKNPLSNELDVMRQTLLFGGLQTISRNLRRQQKSFNYFEWGNVAYKEIERYDVDKPLRQYIESSQLGLWVGGFSVYNNWTEPNKEVSPFSIKAIVYDILDRMSIDLSQRKEVLVDWDIFSGKSLEIQTLKGQHLAYIGKVKSSIAKAHDIDIDIYYAELDWDIIAKIADRSNVQATELSKYPTVKRDLSLLIDTNVTFEDIRSIANKAEKKLLKDIVLFDVYEGKHLPQGKKSYAVSFFLRDDSKTMSDKQIDTIMGKIQNSLQQQLGAELR